MKFALFVFCCAMAMGTHAQATLLTSLELYYSFDNDTSTPGGIADLSGNNRHGSPFDNSGSVNNVGFSMDVPGAISAGKSLDLSAGLDSVRANWTGLAGSGARSISMWVNTMSTNQQVFVEWGDNTNAGERWTFRMENVDSQPSPGASKIGGIRQEIQMDYRTTAAASPAINDGEWNHIAVVYNPGTTQLEAVTMYINGSAIFTTDNAATISINTVPLNNLAIGGTAETGLAAARIYTGLIDEVGIWSRVLTPQEITDLATGSVVPEPSTAILVLIGMSGFACVCRRKMVRSRNVR